MREQEEHKRDRMQNDFPAEAPVSLEGDGSGAKVSSEL